jgi:uncharacterized protein
MASRPPNTAPTARELMTLGMFVFGMSTAAYQDLQRSREWRHATSERHGARDAAQFIGPGPDTVTLAGLLVPEVAGTFSSLETLATMADAGDTYPLIDGLGRIFGHYRITRMEEQHLSVMAGGLPRHVGFRIELARGDDEVDAGASQ